MKFVKRNEIDDLKWDALIEHSNSGLIYGLSWFLDKVVESWDAVIWEENNEYIAVFPIPHRKKMGIQYVYPPFFIQQLGLFSIDDTDNLQRTTEVLAFLQKNYRFIELNVHSVLKEGDLKSNYIKYLAAPYAELAALYSSNHKRNIKKTHDLVYTEELSPVEVIDLFKGNKGKEVTTYQSQDYLNFDNLIATAIEKKAAFCIGAKLGEEAVAGAIILKFKNRITFLFSGLSEKGKLNGASFFLLDRLINKYSNQDVVLDFEGGASSNIERFYKGFGAEEEQYTFLRYNNLPFYLKWLKK